MIRKILIDEKRKGKFYIKDLDKDYHTKFGYVKSEDLKNAKPGDLVQNSRENESFRVLDPDFIDSYRRIRRSAQIMSLKDLGYILALTGIGAKSVIVEAGTGSGAAACFLARHVKEVFSYDISQDNIDIAKGNAKELGISNIKFQNADVYEQIPASDADMILLDLTRPWDAVENADCSLKIGGFLVAYCPCITQTQEFINKVRENGSFLVEKNVDILERDWEIDKKKVRPCSGPISHTGFISIVRKIR